MEIFSSVVSLCTPVTRALRGRPKRHCAARGCTFAGDARETCSGSSGIALPLVCPLVLWPENSGCPGHLTLPGPSSQRRDTTGRGLVPPPPHPCTEAYEFALRSLGDHAGLLRCFSFRIAVLCCCLVSNVWKLSFRVFRRVSLFPVGSLVQSKGTPS